MLLKPGAPDAEAEASATPTMPFNSVPLSHTLGWVLMTCKKDDFVRSLYDKVGLSKGQSVETVESLLNIMKETLASGEELVISGFGKFIARSKAQRKGRNPSSGEALILGARRVVRFRSSPVLVNKINGKT